MPVRRAIASRWPAVGSVGVANEPPGPANRSTTSGPVSIVFNRGAESKRGSAQNGFGLVSVLGSPKAAMNCPSNVKPPVARENARPIALTTLGLPSQRYSRPSGVI